MTNRDPQVANRVPNIPNGSLSDSKLPANSRAGLTLVKTQTIGTGVSNVVVSNAFNATFDNYKIIVSNASVSSTDYLGIRFGSASVDGYYGLLYSDLTAGPSVSTQRRHNGSEILVTLGGLSSDTFISMDVYSPYLAARTGVSGSFFGGFYSGWFSGQLATTSSYTSFTLTTINPITMTGGEIKVYGYRNSI